MDSQSTVPEVGKARSSLHGDRLRNGALRGARTKALSKHRATRGVIVVLGQGSKALYIFAYCSH